MACTAKGTTLGTMLCLRDATPLKDTRRLRSSHRNSLTHPFSALTLAVPARHTVSTSQAKVAAPVLPGPSHLHTSLDSPLPFDQTNTAWIPPTLGAAATLCKAAGHGHPA